MPVRQLSRVRVWAESLCEGVILLCGWHMRHKRGYEVDDDEYNNIMNELWKRLRETHKIRVVK